MISEVPDFARDDLDKIEDSEIFVRLINGRLADSIRFDLATSSLRRRHAKTMSADYVGFARTFGTAAIELTRFVLDTTCSRLHYVLTSAITRVDFVYIAQLVAVFPEE